MAKYKAKKSAAIKISACYMVKNAEKDLARSLESLKKYVDEIIVVDTGSTDSTVEVAKKFGAKIFHETWQDDFSTPRNVAIREAAGDWIVFLDADEYFVNNTAKNLREVIKLAQKAKAQGVSVNLLNVDADNGNKIINGSHVLRIFEKAPNVRYVGKIHEEVYNGDKILNRITAPANLLTIYHTGYSSSIIKAKLERNLKALLEELATSDTPEKLYAYLVDCYYGLSDWANAEKYARLELDARKNPSNRPVRILIEILEKDPARFEECFEISKLAVERYPKVPEFSAKLADCFAKRGDYRKAVEEMKRAIDKAKNYKDEFESSNFDATKIKIAQELIETWSTTISLCYMVKNAEKDLKISLDSVAQFVDEIIVVDTGSTDDTVEVAKKFGAKIFYEKWQDDFSTPRNVAIREAKGSWIVFLDADEYFVNDTAQNIRKAIKLAKKNKFQGLSISWINVDADNDNKIIDASHALRIFENAPGLHYVGKIHETPFIGDKILSNITMTTDDLLMLYHTGYSTSIVKEKFERNLKLLLEELNTSDAPERVYSYLVDCYYGLGDWANAEKYARLHVEKIKSLSTRPLKILLDILSKEPARTDDYLETLKLAIKNYPKNPEFSAQLAKFYAQQGDWRPAVKEMETALEKFSKRDGTFTDSDFDEQKEKSARKLIETWSQTISACYIVKNGAKDLKNSLNSVAQYVDEIIVVDTGSTDNTIGVAKEFGAKIFHETWQNDFATPRNVALNAAKGSWILFLDADEYFVKGTAQNLRRAIELAQEKNIKGILVSLINVDTDNENKNLGGSRVLRLYENVSGIHYVGKIHEQLFIGDELLTSLIAVPSDLLLIWHTGYSASIHKEKMERNLKALLDELATTDNPKRIYGYLAETYQALEDNDNAEKYARLDFDTGETLSTASTRILLEILSENPAKIDDYLKYLKLTIERYPKVPEFSAKLAEALADKGEYQAAVDEMNRAFDKVKNRDENSEASTFGVEAFNYSQKLLEKWQGKICEQMKNFTPEEKKREIERLTNELLQYKELFNDSKRILQIAEKIFALKPDEAMPVEKVANVYINYKMTDEAEKVLDYLEEKFPPTRHRTLLRAQFYFIKKNGLEAIKTAERALTLEKDLFLNKMFLFNLLGQAYRLIGNAKKACYHYRANATLDLSELKNSPELEKIFHHARNIQIDEHSNLLFNLHNLNISREELFGWIRDFNKFYKDIPRYKHNIKKHAKHKKIRIGYISPDIRYHVVAFFIMHLFKSYDRTRFEVSIYANNLYDGITKELCNEVDFFRDIFDKPAEEVAEQIFKDEIDILVDLAGHTAGNCLKVMAYKPAPIQISGIGWFDSTGLDTIDYFLADKFTDPEGLNEKFFTEKILRLQHSHFCYVWHDFPHMTTPAPCIKKGYVTFVSFNNFVKVTDEILRAWSEILNAVPNSRLYLKSAVFKENCGLELAKERMTKIGINVERVDFEDIEDNYLQCYERADIALDTYPYPGGGTTCDALYMGIPVITLVGERHNSRFGYSLLMNMGLEELCAFNMTEYIQKAIELANDKERLREYHLTLRRRMEESPVMNDIIYMGEIEQAYEKIFSAWLNKKPLPDFPQEPEPITEELADKYYKRALEYLPLEDADRGSKYKSRFDFKRTLYFAELAAQCPSKVDAGLLLTIADRRYLTDDNLGAYEIMHKAIERLYPPYDEAKNLPNDVLAEYFCKMAKYCQDNGHHLEAIENYERAFDICETPQRKLEYYDAILLTLHFLDIPSEDLAAPHFDYQQFFEGIETFTTYHKPHERIRVGYISGDFRQHAAFSVIFGFISCHDKSKFEVTCYSRNKVDDFYTEIFKKAVEHFVSVKGLTDEQIAQKIHDDEIDIAFDLAGHTGLNGLPALAYKPAPVQICGVGYMSTTGLKAIDYFITDEILDPPNQNREKYFSEKFLYLPSQFCYLRPEKIAPSEGAACVENGYVTFGTICRYSKISNDMLAVWKEILDRVPDAKLIMRAQEFISNKTVDELYNRMKNIGFDVDRVVFRAAVADNDYFQAISKIDIMLDAFPYVGGVTTLDALYMGVPVVNFYGERHSTRFSKSILNAVGLSELSVNSVEAYIQTAVALANDFDTLDILHKNLRQMFLNSDALNPMKYCRALEKKFEEFFR
ncbi:MAG: glycosyltransferase [Selenomonadaceae bacterium]|nr:glycosyltransferase [Selenomonadaceae bacterium]